MQLARAAAKLERTSGLPGLALFMDDERLRDPISAVEALPRGSLVIVRSRSEERRAALAAVAARAAARRGLAWIVADDAELAWRAGAWGAHFPERHLALAARWRARRPRWFITCAVHSLRTCLRARLAGADAVFLSPAFATASHPTQPFLGSLRMRSIGQAIPLPIYALGGIDSRSVRRLDGARLAGFAGVTGLVPSPGALPDRCTATAAPV